jgi:hypothetical protein
MFWMHTEPTMQSKTKHSDLDKGGTELIHESGNFHLHIYATVIYLENIRILTLLYTVQSRDTF